MGSRIVAMASRFIDLCVVTKTALRISYHYRRQPLDSLVEQLMVGRPIDGNLEALSRTVERWLWLLPPRYMRPCLKRSLLLASLNARCGGTPSLHIGVRPGNTGTEGHAWVTPGSVPPEGFVEIISLPRIAPVSETGQRGAHIVRTGVSPRRAF